MAKGKILIVEGDTSVAGDLKETLEAAGYEIAGICASGEEALGKIGDLTLDLVIMDTFPAGTLNGIESAAKIRERWDIPLVYLAAYKDMELLDKAKVTEQYVLKPFDDRELNTAIQIAFSQYTMERALRESEQTVRALLNATTDALMLVDSDGMFLALNDMMAQRLGRPASGVLHTQITDLLASGDVSPALVEKIGFARGGKPVQLEENVKGRWYDTYVYPIASGTGEVVKIAVFSHDITDWKLAQEELAAANRNLLMEKQNLMIYTAAIDAMDDMVVITDGIGSIKYVNPAFEKKFGFKEEEVIGKHLSEFKSPESTYAIEKEAFLADRKSVWNGVIIAKNKFGLKLPLALKSSPILKDNQTVSRVFVLREKS
ncbi:MAG: PAS domain S-box protein [Methanoregulaceae archaeon]